MNNNDQNNYYGYGSSYPENFGGAAQNYGAGNSSNGYTIPSPEEMPMYQQPAPQPAPYTYQPQQQMYQGGYQQPYSAYSYMPPRQVTNTPGFVLGVISIFIAEVPLIGLICSIIGLILSIKSKKESNQPGVVQGNFVIPGIVCSAVGLFLSVLMTLFFVLGLVFALSDPVSYDYDYDGGDGYGYYDDFDWGDYGDNGDAA